MFGDDGRGVSIKKVLEEGSEPITARYAIQISVGNLAVVEIGVKLSRNLIGHRKYTPI